MKNDRLSVAYLILAHHEPEQLGRLVAALRDQQARFYIHVDAKVDAAPFREALKGFDDVQFVEPVRVHWAGFSVVQATLNLLSAAYTQGFQYYTLLSGADYPLASNQQLIQFFSGSEQEHLHYWRLSDLPSWAHKVQYHYPTNRISMHNYQQVFHRRVFWGLFIKLRRFFPKRRYPSGIEPYGGPQWWSLTHDCVGFVLKFCKERPDFVDFYKTTHSPDEGFFHTIVMNSPFKERVAGRDVYEAWRLQGGERTPEPSEERYIRYANWDERESVGSPGTFETRHFEKLLGSGKLFARKFSPQKSATLLDRIDKARAEADHPKVG